MGYNLQEFVISNVEALVTSNGTVIDINVDLATRQLQAILNEAVQETGQNPMMMDIGVIMISLEKKMEILEENVE